MQPVVIGDVVWEPSAETIERSRLQRFISAHSLTSFQDLLYRANEEPDWFWDAVVKDLGIVFREPYERVLDSSQGMPWTTWFGGARMNIYDSCVTRHLDSGRAAAPALSWEGEPGEVIHLTYEELDGEVSRLAGALR